jgi:hypothetical protein
MDEMYDEDFGVVDLDAVDDDRDADTDAASAEMPPAVAVAPRRSRPVDRTRAGAAVLRGAAIGGAAYAGGAAVRRHPKLTLGAAILAALIALTPADQRPQLIKRIGVAVAVLAGLAVLLVGVVLLIGVAMPSPSGVTPAPTVTSTAPAAPSCQWGPALCPKDG